MSDADQRFHETWLGMLQPVVGLVVSVPVLVEAQCAERLVPDAQSRLRAACVAAGDGELRCPDLGRLLRELLGYPNRAVLRVGLDAFTLFVPEGPQVVRPTAALCDPSDTGKPLVLVWELPDGLDLDRPETVTGAFEYPPTAKLDRLLRHFGVPIGLLTNGRAFRLVYAPSGEATGTLTFRLDDMSSVGGRPILDAFVMLLSAHRLYGVAPERTLPRILEDSRRWQARVSDRLAEQVLEAAGILLEGLQEAARRDGDTSLLELAATDGDHVHRGILSVLLRIVFLLYAEDASLMPTDHDVYRQGLSITTLYDRLREDAAAYPDSMGQRFGAWGYLLTAFRAVFFGVTVAGLRLPPRRGTLFDPHRFPFLEGWTAGSSPVGTPEARAAVRVPTVSDRVVLAILERLMVLEGQRVSFRSLDVEQIGSVYERMLGFTVVRLVDDAVCVRGSRRWLMVGELADVAAARRARWLRDNMDVPAALAERVSRAYAGARTADERRRALEMLAAKEAGGKAVARDGGALVLQPRESTESSTSHYTPRSLSRPLVARALEPVLRALGDAPTPEQILSLKICDPAMGSGAFLVEACRFLAERLVAAWRRDPSTRAGGDDVEDPLTLARRVVAQRCLYGVDRNADAVELAKLSLWLVTLSKTLPFTFLDHSLRHGDSLVGLDFDQLRAFHWKRPEEKEKKKAAPKQLELFGREIAMALDEAIALRQKIGDLGDAPVDDREKERLLWDAQDALDRVRLIGDLVVGAFFAHDKDKDREKERARREELVRAWLATGGPPSEELREMQRDIRARLPVFHWMVEFPEVFYAERPDPLDGDGVNRAAYMDGFVGNPPFAGKNRITEANGPGYVDWLMALHPDVIGKPNTDLSAYFFRQTSALLGAHGTIGLIATNTIAQGDSRLMSLKHLVDRGAEIYAARSTMPWPGTANVAVSVAHLALGTARSGVRARELDGRAVDVIDSRLTPRRERPEAVTLRANANLSFMGGKLVGAGLAVSLEQHAELLAADPRNREVLRPYLGGEEVNRNPGGGFDRYMIDFTTKSLEEARTWPTLMGIVEKKVRPAREKDNRGTYKTYRCRSDRDTRKRGIFGDLSG